MRSNARVSRIPVCGTRSATTIATADHGQHRQTDRTQQRVAPLVVLGPRLHTRDVAHATAAVPRITPLAVEQEAAMMAESTRIASPPAR